MTKHTAAGPISRRENIGKCTKHLCPHNIRAKHPSSDSAPGVTENIRVPDCDGKTAGIPDPQEISDSFCIGQQK